MTTFLKQAWDDLPGVQKPLLLVSLIVLLTAPRSLYEFFLVAVLLCLVLLFLMFYDLHKKKVLAAALMMIPVVLLFVFALYLRLVVLHTIIPGIYA
jgi:hypothetical protein